MKNANDSLPLISVIVPVFDAETTIVATLKSILRQDYANIEVLVVDDASRDETGRLVSEVAAGDRRLHILCHERNLGPAVARNTGLAQANGRYCAFIDSDDEWLPGKLSLQVAALLENPQAVLCCCNAVWIRDGVPEGTVYDGCAVMSGSDAWIGMLEDVYVGTPCAVVDTAMARQLGGFDATLRVGEDQDLWLRLAFVGEVIALPHVLVKYRRALGSYMDRNRERSITDWLPRLETHIHARRDLLSAPHYRRIMRRLYERMARGAYEDLRWQRAASLFAKAFRYGANPLGTAVYLVIASPLAQVLKRRIRLIVYGHVRPV
jgi:glycosyltransferase involved in cell wall biosynthesis